MSTLDNAEQARSTAESVARRSYGKLVAFLAARTRDVAAAEDALSEAFAAALADWPRNGCPANPEAWLLTVARRKAIDSHRGIRHESALEDLLIAGEISTPASAQDHNRIPDDRLALMFVCAHPAIDPAIRAPLILQSILGLDAVRIASAFLTSPAAMGKRLVRAKGKIRDAAIPFQIPALEELPARLEAVLDAIYAAFTEGWPDASGTSAARADLTAEALFLARLVYELQPQEPEAAGLLALVLYVEARRNARRDPQGEYVPLVAQDPALWDSEKIAQAETLLRDAGRWGRVGRYQLEAALQSAHISRCVTGRDNRTEVLQLYDALLALTESPVVAINRALALAETEGPAAALDAIDHLATDARLATYQPWWAARADLLARSGAYAQSRHAYEMAIGLEPDAAVRRFLEQRRDALSR